MTEDDYLKLFATVKANHDLLVHTIKKLDKIEQMNLRLIDYFQIQEQFVYKKVFDLNSFNIIEGKLTDPIFEACLVSNVAITFFLFIFIY